VALSTVRRSDKASPIAVMTRSPRPSAGPEVHEKNLAVLMVNDLRQRCPQTYQIHVA
jgi:hypothetical protein